MYSYMKNEFKYLLITFLGWTCFCSGLSAQEPLFFLSKDSLQAKKVFHLSADWKYHPGDSPIWASPDYDDSDWEMVNSELTWSAMPASGWQGLGWFRKYIKVDSLLDILPIGLLMAHDGASDVYIDGQLSFQFGSAGTSSDNEIPFTVFPNQLNHSKTILLQGGKTYLFAVRYSNFVLYNRGITSRVGFTFVLADLNATLSEAAADLRFSAGFLAVVVVVPLVFSISHLLLFIFQRRQQEHLYFAIFTFCIATLGFLVQENTLGFETDTRKAWVYFLIVYDVLLVLGLTGIKFLYSLFYAKSPKLLWGFLSISVFQGILVWLLPFDLARLTLLVFALMLFEMVRVASLAIYRKNEDAWLIGGGFFFFTATGVLLVLFVMQILPQNTIFPRLFWFAGVFVLPLTMSAFLARRFMRVSTSLETEIDRSTELRIQNARQEVELQKAGELKQAYEALEEAHNNLQATQQQLITQEKLASLGQLTAGIAHEIKNPLNFVNNFAELSQELVDELRESVTKGEPVEDVLGDLEQNVKLIAQHGKRADSIVKSMMQHARGGKGDRVATDVNALVEEYVGLAYHGRRAKAPDFNVTILRDFGQLESKVNIVPQEIGRVLLNLLANAFDALSEHVGSNGEEFEPMVSVSTRQTGAAIEIAVMDNGPGMPAELRNKIFEPFFTTKPAGSGTGLGLSLSYDIVTQGHRGMLTVESTENEGATFIISLPIEEN